MPMAPKSLEAVFLIPAMVLFTLSTSCSLTLNPILLINSEIVNRRHLFRLFLMILLLQLLRPPPFDIHIHAVEGVQLQSFIEGVDRFKLQLRCNPGFDEDIHSHLQLRELGQVEVSPFLVLGACF